MSTDAETQTTKPTMRKLAAFARKHCANWDTAQRRCIVNDECLLNQGKACHYFQRSVWPICDPAYRWATETKAHPELVGEYRILYGKAGHQDARRCACGAVLQPRLRVCDKCKQRNRRTAYRRYKDKKHACATVSHS